MFKRLHGTFSHDLSIDPGTVNTLIYVRGAGIKLDQPSLAAVRTTPQEGKTRKVKTRTIAAVGLEARRMLADAANNLAAVRPIKDGMIADLNATERMLQEFIREVRGGRFIKPRVLVAVPCAATPLERRAIRESVLHAGARQAYLIEGPMAAAIGAGLPVDHARGSMVFNLGGGTSEVAVVCLNSIVFSSSTRTGGEHLNDAISNYVRRSLGVLIDETQAERIKREIGCAWHASEVRRIEVDGRDADDGSPRCLTLNSEEIHKALEEALSSIVTLVTRALQSISPELASDLAEYGIVLTGGGALLRDIDRLLTEQTGVNVCVAEDPLTCVARGGGRVLELIDEYGVHVFGIE